MRVMVTKWTDSLTSQHGGVQRSRWRRRLSPAELRACERIRSLRRGGSWTVASPCRAESSPVGGEQEAITWIVSVLFRQRSPLDHACSYAIPDLLRVRI